MSFIAPLAMIAAAIVGPIIVAMYLLKLRREDRAVSSTFLWQRMVRDVEANAPWQKLRRNLLLLLQLLLLLLLVLALARPFVRSTGISGRNLILVIDHSASMSAVDVGASRLDEAKSQAITLVDQLPDGGRATVIAAGGQMTVPAASTSDRRELRDAINGITISTSGGSDISQALTLAAALAAREEESEVAIISDGNVTLPNDLTVPATVRYFPVGRSDDNVAISQMTLQPGPASQTLFVQATNHGSSTVERRIDIYLDGALFNAVNVVLEAGSDVSQVFEVPPQVTVAEARLGQPDGLPLDDQAVAVSSQGTATGVRIIGSGNRFLETGLSLLSGVEVTTLPPGTSTFTESVAQVPLTVMDAVVPETLPPGNLFFIAPPRGTEFFSVTGTLEFPALRPVPGDNPLLRDISLSEVNVLEAVRTSPGAWARVLVDSDGAPLLYVGERDGRRIAVLAFDLRNSDLPLQVAFPLLLSNLVGYLVPGSGAEAAQITPGQPLAIQIDESISEVRVIRPDGSLLSSADGAVQLQGSQAVYADTEELGVYTVEQYNGDELVARRRFAANLFAPAESAIEPQADLSVQQSSGLQSTAARDRVGRQEFWRWLAAIALAVLIIEWLVYNRSSLAYLRERWQQRAATARK